MRCCGIGSWPIWHPILKENVAWACRKCDKVTPVPSREDCERWSQCAWRRYKRVLEGKNDGARLVSYQTLLTRPPRKTTVIGDTKDCSVCQQRLPLDSFSIDRRERRSEVARYKAACKPCMVKQDRKRQDRRNEARRRRGKR